MTFDTAFQLGFFGAKVLQAGAMETFADGSVFSELTPEGTRKVWTLGTYSKGRYLGGSDGWISITYPNELSYEDMRVLYVEHVETRAETDTKAVRELVAEKGTLSIKEIATLVDDYYNKTYGLDEK